MFVPGYCCFPQDAGPSPGCGICKQHHHHHLNGGGLRTSSASHCWCRCWCKCWCWCWCRLQAKIVGSSARNPHSRNFGCPRGGISSPAERRDIQLVSEISGVACCTRSCGRRGTLRPNRRLERWHMEDMAIWVHPCHRTFYCMEYLRCGTHQLDGLHFMSPLEILVFRDVATKVS